MVIWEWCCVVTATLYCAVTRILVWVKLVRAEQYFHEKFDPFHENIGPPGPVLPRPKLQWQLVSWTAKDYHSIFSPFLHQQAAQQLEISSNGSVKHAKQRYPTWTNISTSGPFSHKKKLSCHINFPGILVPLTKIFIRPKYSWQCFV